MSRCHLYCKWDKVKHYSPLECIAPIRTVPIDLLSSIYKELLKGQFKVMAERSGGKISEKGPYGNNASQSTHRSTANTSKRKKLEISRPCDQAG